MKPAQLAADLETFDHLSGVDALCCLITQDERPLSGAAGFLDWRLCGELSSVLRSGFFSGAPGDQLLLPTEGRVPPAKLFAVGLGTSMKVTPLGLEQALTQAASMLSRAKIDSVALLFPQLPAEVAGLRDELIARGFAPHFSGAVAVFDARGASL